MEIKMKPSKVNAKTVTIVNQTENSNAEKEIKNVYLHKHFKAIAKLTLSQ